MGIPIPREIQISINKPWEQWRFWSSRNIPRKEKIIPAVWQSTCSVAKLSDTLWLNRLQHTNRLWHTRPPVPHHLLKLMSIESFPCPMDAIQPSHPLSPSSSLPAIIPSIRVFSNESALHVRWPKYWNLSFSISPTNEYSGLISFGTDWFDLLSVQGTLKSLL